MYTYRCILCTYMQIHTHTQALYATSRSSCNTSLTHVSLHICTYISIGQPGEWSVKRLATSWPIRGSNPGMGARFSLPVPIGPRRPFNLLHNGYQVSCPEAKRRGVMLNTKVRGRVTLRLSPADVSSWHFTKGTLPILLPYVYYLPPHPHPLPQ